jgi:protein-export membrane protein SecD
MDRNLLVRMLVILAVLGVCGFVLFPTYKYFSKYHNLTPEQVAALPEAERRAMRETYMDSMKLGLDLQGGMHLVMEIDESTLDEGDIKDAQDRVLEILSTRVDQFGVAEPTLARQGNNRILLQLPGVDDPERAKSVVKNTAKLRLHMVRDAQDVVRILQEIDAALAAKGPSDSAAAKPREDASPPAPSPASPTAATDTTAARADTTLFPELAPPPAEAPEAGGTNPFTRLIVAFQYGALYVPDDGYKVERVRELIEDEAVRAILRRERSMFQWSSEAGPRTADGLPSKLLYLVNQQVELGGERLKDARVAPDSNRPGGMLVSFRLDRRGARTFREVTRDNVGKQLAIVLDNIVKSAPRIDGPIPSGEGQITGSFTDAEAADLALVLRVGALPVDLNVIEERTVGPTLGADSLRKGLVASVVGLALSILFMVVYYRFSGLLAAVALLMNMVIVVTAMAILGASLSLPGIAGLVLSVAMGVDANVLIFERIREELRKAKTVNASIEAGYKNAFSAIIDSNLTTLFAGVVLLYFGTGPLKGFAVTLCIGIMASMFTALFVTRFFYDSITRHRRLEKLSI